MEAKDMPRCDRCPLEFSDGYRLGRKLGEHNGAILMRRHVIAMLDKVEHKALIEQVRGIGTQQCTMKSLEVTP